MWILRDPNPALFSEQPGVCAPRRVENVVLILFLRTQEVDFLPRVTKLNSGPKKKKIQSS
jgi:hypothetical protein